MEERKGTGAKTATDPGGAELAVRPDQDFWTARQVAALRALGITHATNADLALFLHYCARTKLDPFSRQIYMLERRTKNRDTNQWEYAQTIQVGIDGYRVIGQRAARNEEVYLEYEPTIWFDAKGNRHDVWLGAEPPFAALVVVVKHLPNGTVLRFPGIARFSSYAAWTREGNLQGQWGVMADHMIEKCAEAFALRRAFPHDLGGMYVEEELQHTPPPKLKGYRRDPETADEFVVQGEALRTAAPAPEDDEDTERDDDTQDGENEPPAPPPTRQQANRRIHAIFSDHGLGDKADAKVRGAVIAGLLNLDVPTSSAELSAEQMGAAVEALARFCDEAEVREENVHDALVKLASARLGAQR